MSRMLFAAVAILLVVNADAQSCQGPGFRINGCDLTKPILDDNRCGIAADGNPCPFGACCGENGQCGRSYYHCGTNEMPAWGPPRDDKRCGITYRYAGCEKGSVCVSTTCLPQEFIQEQLKAWEGGNNNGNFEATLVPEAELNPSPVNPPPVDPSPEMDAPACQVGQDNGDACAAPSSGTSGSGKPSSSRGKDPDFIEITETVEERDNYMKNSATLGNVLSTILAIPIIMMLLQVFL